MPKVIDTMPVPETGRMFLRRGAVVVAVLVALAGAAVFLTSRDDSRTARDLCAGAARAQLAAPVGITATDRTDDDTFVVRGSAGTRAFTCLVVREPLTGTWEVSAVR